MSYRVKLTDTAKQDLREIALWLAEKTKNSRVAKAFVAELYTKCKTLDTFPDAGAFPRDRILRSAGYRFIVHSDYLIFYLVEKETKTVTIMAVFNGKKDYTREMKKFI